MVEADLPAYKQLRDDLLEAHPDAFTSDAETERGRDVTSYRSRLSLGNGGTTLFTLLAHVDGQLVGALTVEREPRRKVQHIAHIIGMMVRGAWQGHGIGRGLMRKALDRLAQDPSLKLVTLSVTESNATAVRLYRGCGFEPYGCLRRAIRLDDGRELDKLLMSKTLQT
jgi:RimJ/RimL family protein N-acetyltransferase